MTQPSTERLRHLCEVVEREIQHLQLTDRHLFAEPFTANRAEGLNSNHNEAERVDAFVARFGRLQDTTGDKLLPALLGLLGNEPGPVIDNLNLIAKWGWLEQPEHWLEARWLRNRMIHEYIRDPALLSEALNEAHLRVPLLVQTAQRLTAEAHRRIPDA